jgi:hypothetical protein
MLPAAEGHERLRRYQCEQMDRAAGTLGAARGETQRQASLVGLVHDHKVNPHRKSAPALLEMYQAQSYSAQGSCPSARIWPET